MKEAERNVIVCVLHAQITCLPPPTWEEFGRADLTFGKKLKAMIQNYAVIWDTSKILLISELLYWLQVLGCLIIPEKAPSGCAMCVPRSHSFVPTCSLWHLSQVLCCLTSSGWVTWGGAARTKVHLKFPHLGSSSWLRALDEGRNEWVWGEKGRTWGTSGGTSPGVSSAGLLCSCCLSSPGSGVQHHLYTDFWGADEPVFSVPEVLSWQQTEHKASSTPGGS